MITDDLTALIRDVVLKARDAGEFPLSRPDIRRELEMPRNKQHGDFSSNIALALKRATGLSDSRDIAARILKYLPTENALIARVEAALALMNFDPNPAWLHDTLLKIEVEDTRYGTGNAREGERVLIEFVSANPTGPISVVNGRAAVLGDVPSQPSRLAGQPGRARVLRQ